jgi:uncharacterized iron-regulated membrane protein
MSSRTDIISKRRLKRSIIRLHSCLGLPLGWLFFMIFVMGSLSYIRLETNFWMRPEAHHIKVPEQYYEWTAVEKALKFTLDVQPWPERLILSLPGPRDPVVVITRVLPQTENIKEAPVFHLERQAFDPLTGDQVFWRETAGGDFFYRLHMELYGLDRKIGWRITGLSALLMLVVIISGLLSHRNRIRSLFAFRPGGNKLAWRDAHIITAMMALPFHLMVALSGVFLLAELIFPWAFKASYGRETAAFISDIQKRQERQPLPWPGQFTERFESHHVRIMLERADSIWPDTGAGLVVINQAHEASTSVMVIQAAEHNRLGGHSEPERLVYDYLDDELLLYAPNTNFAPGISFWNTLRTIHMGRFATPGVRLLLLWSGFLGSIMIATGIIFWQKARPKFSRSHSWLERLIIAVNTTAISGLMFAIAIYLTASRFLPAELPGRDLWEVRVFFAAWAACFIQAILRPIEWAALKTQLMAAGFIFCLIPFFNSLTGGVNFFVSFSVGLPQLAFFELSVFCLGLFLIYGARLVSHQPKRQKVVN